MTKKLIICFLFLFLPFLFVQAEGTPTVLRYLFNGSESDVSINPTADKDQVLNISIDVDRNVKLTRVYFCSESTGADNCTQEYVKYVSPNTEGTTVTAVWDGYKKGDSGPADPGQYWLRILLKEGENASFPINLTQYKITVGEVSVVPTSTDDTNSSTTATTTKINTEQTSGSGGLSSHTSQAGLSSIKTKSPTVGAGRNRLTTVGTPVAFEAWSENAGSSGDYNWSFGDGTLVAGEKVSHSYSFPGTYNVVLNANFNGREAVSRTVVQVFIPEISIKTIDPVLGYIELGNNAAFETNLFGWSLSCGDKTFSFPRDTIIDAKSNLKIPVAVTGCSASTTVWSLTDQGGKVSLVYQTPIALNNSFTDRERVIDEIKQKINLIAIELEKRKEQISYLGQERTFVAEDIATESINIEVVTPVPPVSDVDPSLQTAGMVVLDKEPLPVKKSLFGWIKAWLGR